MTLNLPDYGKILGSRSEGLDRYLGIPYAAPPVGERRFSPPEPVTPWHPRRLDGRNYADDCLQIVDLVNNPRVGPMSEDCLYLNIFTPTGYASRTNGNWLVKGREGLPVMVWLHGGAFQQGSGNREEVRREGKTKEAPLRESWIQNTTSHTNMR